MLQKVTLPPPFPRGYSAADFTQSEEGGGLNQGRCERTRVTERLTEKAMEQKRTLIQRLGCRLRERPPGLPMKGPVYSVADR